VISWSSPQNQASYSLSDASQNQWEGDDMGHTSRSRGLLHVEASRAMVSQSGLKTGRGAMAGGARGIIVEVVSRSS
jgi:hypothetical protein